MRERNLSLLESEWAGFGLHRFHSKQAKEIVNNEHATEIFHVQSVSQFLNLMDK